MTRSLCRVPEERDLRDFPGFIGKEKITESCVKGQALCPKVVKTCLILVSRALGGVSSSPDPRRRARLPEGPPLTQQDRAWPQPHIMA